MYSVIFSSKKRSGADDYAAEAERIANRARQMPGFIRMESVRDTAGYGITVCYWESLEAIRAWKQDAEHRAAQEQGKERWYDEYRITVANVEYEYSHSEE